MKKCMLLALVAMVFAACEPNVPELNDNSRKMLIGRWEVVKETMTNGDGFGSVVTREGKDLLLITTYEITDKLISYEVTSNNKDIENDYHSDKYSYSLQQQTDKTWLLRINKIVTIELVTGDYSPITIHKITDNKIEWEYESYGGDEGPVGYYQYLKRIE